MKVLLLSPPYLADYMRNGRCDYVSWSRTQWYPIWLAYCGALLEKCGHRVELIDAPAERLSYKETLERISDFSPRITVVYSSTKSKQSDINFCEEVKKSTGCYIVFAGPYVSAEPDSFVNSSIKIDAVVQGEFDYPILELANGLEKSKIKNLSWRQNGQIISNESRPFLNREELDNIPFVTEFYLRHLKLKNYRVPSELHPFIDMFTGRGCIWGRCLFCLWPHSFIKGKVYNTRSIENVIGELQFVHKQMPYIKEVFIQDDTLPRQRAIELSNAILDGKLDIIWSCYVRGDLDYTTLRLMRKAGCRTLHVGYESRNNLILKNVVKGLTAEEMTEFTYNAHKAGLRIHGDFLLGLPGETQESIKETIRWAKLLSPETAQFLPLNLYPNSPLDNENYSLQLTRQRLHKLILEAYRNFYFSWQFLKKVFLEPGEYLFRRIPAVRQMIFNILSCGLQRLPGKEE